MDNGSDKKNLIKKAVRYAGNVLTVLAVIFLIRNLLKMDIELSMLLNGRVLTGLVISIFICIGAGLLFAYNWYNVLSSLTPVRISCPAAVSVYLKANMAKYIPGNVFHYVERNLFAEKVGLDQKKIALSSFLEITGQICAAVTLSILLLNRTMVEVLHTMIKAEAILWEVGVFLCGLVIATVIYVIRHKCIRAVLLYLVCYTLLGMGMVVMVAAIHGTWIGRTDARLVMGTYIFSWLAGFVVPGAPGGIGIRELVVTLLTDGSALGETVMLAAILHRLASVISDAVTYVIGLIMDGKNRNREITDGDPKAKDIIQNK